MYEPKSNTPIAPLWYRSRWRLILLLTLAVAAVGSAQTPTGSIVGSVQTVDGRPVVNAEVFVGFRPARPGDPPIHFNAVTMTGADGTFNVPNVPNGTFAVCPSGGRPSLLPPCMWNPETVVTVANGQTVTAPIIQMKAGSDLFVRVNDPHGARARAEGISPGAGLMLAVRTPAGFVLPIAMTAVDGVGADHHLMVPTNVDLVLVAFSSSYSMSDADGLPIDQSKGYARSFNIQSGTQQHRESITIN
jgi:hypothetical protein